MNVKDLVHPSNEDCVKMILSAGDRFPGFYRYTLSPRLVRGKQLQFADLMRLRHDPTQYHRNQWLSETTRYYDDIEHRDLAHSDTAIYTAMRDRYRQWMLNADSYGLVCYDASDNTEPLALGQCYFFMGSLVILHEDRLEIGVDQYAQTTVQTITCNGREILAWLHHIYRSTHHELFLPARVVGNLTFSEDDLGTLDLSDEMLIECLSFTNPVVFACNNDTSLHQPIRWAKDIVLTGVGR